MNVCDSNLLSFVYKFCLLKQLPVVAGDAGRGNLSLSLFFYSAACKHAGLCHIHSPLFNNLSVLLFILEHASLHCQCAFRRPDRDRKKSCLCFLSHPPPVPPLSQQLLQHVTSASRQPLIPILSTSGSRIEHHTPLAIPPLPPHAWVV